jgi:membrane-bound metal-dependent hydrolase YbcI (DUF457 family)
LAARAQRLEAVMIAGHFGFAAAVKAKAPSVPLWALMLASQWLDVVFVPLLLAGVERFEPIAGTRPGAYGAAIIHADYTHSFVGAVLLAALFGALLAVRYGKQSGVVLAFVVLSHWFLDLPLHRADMQFLPGASGVLGFGLWQYPLVAAGLELGLVIVGAALYWRAAGRVAFGDAGRMRRARICGASVLAAGALTLALNLMGM